MPQPYKLVPTPAVEPYRYGLWSQALEGNDHGDRHTYLGVEYEALAAYAADVRPGSCYQTPAGADLAADARIGTIHGLPFSIYAGLDGTAVGHTEDELVARATTVLDLGSQHAAESALWTGAGATVGLNAATTTVVGTGLSVTAGLAAAEDYLAQHYSGVGLIHAPRLLASFADRHGLLHDTIPRGGDGPKQLETVLGTGLVFGGGYNNTGPNNVAPAANHAWIYLTGVVEAFRATPFISGGLAQALNRATNRAVIWVEQPTVLTVDSLAPTPQVASANAGPVAAIDIDLTL